MRFVEVRVWGYNPRRFSFALRVGIGTLEPISGLVQLERLDLHNCRYLTGTICCSGTTSELTHWWSRRSSSATEPESIDDLEPRILPEAYWCVSLKLGCGGTTSELTHWWIRGSSRATEPESIDGVEPPGMPASHWSVSFRNLFGYNQALT